MTWTSQTYLPLTVPVLPLDGHVLMPAARAPYRVTEKRHRALVGDLLERPADQRWIGVPARHGTDISDELGTLGLMTVATPLAGGDFIIVIEGRSACRLEPIPGDTELEYRCARARHMLDRPEPLLEARAQTTRLVQALFSLYDAFLLAAADLPATDHGVDDAGIVYRIGAAVIEDPRARIELLAERCPSRRRTMVMQVITEQLAFAQREKLLGRSTPQC
ncbi:MAG: hypothetical protein U1F43_19075 [Myxococcota bacterium]